MLESFTVEDVLEVMSYIPDCRAKTKINPYTGEDTGEPNAYYEGNLNEKNKIEIRGYDWCQEVVTSSFFDNLDTMFGEDSYIMHYLNEELPEDMKDEYEIEYTFGDREDEVVKVETYLDLLQSKMMDWIEDHRDELITSMIEGQDEA